MAADKAKRRMPATFVATAVTRFEAVSSPQFLAAPALRPLFGPSLCAPLSLFPAGIFVFRFRLPFAALSLGSSPARFSSASVAAPHTALVTRQPASTRGFNVATHQVHGTPRLLGRSGVFSGRSLTMRRAASLAAAPLPGAYTEHALAASPGPSAGTAPGCCGYFHLLRPPPGPAGRAAPGGFNHRACCSSGRRERAPRPGGLGPGSLVPWQVF